MGQPGKRHDEPARGVDEPRLRRRLALEHDAGIGRVRSVAELTRRRGYVTAVTYSAVQGTYTAGPGGKRRLAGVIATSTMTHPPAQMPAK